MDFGTPLAELATESGKRVNQSEVSYVRSASPTHSCKETRNSKLLCRLLQRQPMPPSNSPCALLLSLFQSSAALIQYRRSRRWVSVWAALIKPRDHDPTSSTHVGSIFDPRKDPAWMPGSHRAPRMGKVVNLEPIGLTDKLRRPKSAIDFPGPVPARLTTSAFLA